MTTYALNKSNANVADFSHAGKIFTSGNMERAPKTKYLYHVVFKMNPLVLGRNIDKANLSVLVKSAELPKVSIQTDTLNQYNRKKHTQVKVDYLPVVLRFHDDSTNDVANLWKTYFTYYYSDSATASIPGISTLAFSRNAMDNLNPNVALPGTARFGYDSGNYAKFFNSIQIYHMSRGSWYMYELINPIISNWTHDSLDSSNNAPSEQSMTLMYEAINYDSGGGKPPGFGSADRYDVVKTPWKGYETTAERTTATNKLVTASTNETASTAQNTTYQTNNPTSATATVPNLNQTIANGVTASSASTNISGIKNVSFPSTSQVQTIQASQVTL